MALFNQELRSFRISITRKQLVRIAIAVPQLALMGVLLFYLSQGISHCPMFFDEGTVGIF
jgi:hypothetical protein